MKALRLPGVSGSGTDLAGRAAGFLSLILLITGVPAAAEESQAAVWKVKEATFLYRSSLAIYSCGALRDRVTSVLRAIGARDDLDVRVSGCDVPLIPVEESMSPWGGTPSDRLPTGRPPTGRLSSRSADQGQLAQVRIRAMMPTKLTPAVLAEIDRDKSRRELVSRVTGDPAAKLNDPIVFPAQWQTVTLSRHSIGLVAEECELLEQMSRVIQQLGARVVRRSFSCDHRSVSHIPPQITVEAFLGVPFGTGIAPQTPAAGASEGEGEPDPGAPAAADAPPSEPSGDSQPK